MTPVFCAAAIEPAVKPYNGMMWFSYSLMVTATTGVLHGSLAPVKTGTNVTTIYNNDIMMVALNQLADGVLCNKPKTVVDIKATP